MLSEQEAKDILLSEYKDYAIETSSDFPNFYVFSLRHKSFPIGVASTGGACFLVHKKTKKIEVCSIYDKRLHSEDGAII